MRSPIRISVAASFIIGISTGIGTAGSLHGITKVQENAALPAKEAGARYGEAAGAALVCYGLKITPRVAELRARYQGSDLDAFDDQAKKVLQAWREILNCQRADGPNDCKVSQQWSCRQAVQEIGPSGSAVQGLVEPKE